MTYSIVGRDPQTRQLGVAVQSHYLAVGSRVPWGRAGVGVVATQAVSDPSYGIGGLEGMARSLDPQDALDACLERDPKRDARQVAMLNSEGVGAAHTGSLCWQYAAHHTARDVSAQSNMCASREIPAAMAAAFLAGNGPLGERLLAALDAAQALGGDLRGQQSAAVLVVDGEAAAENTTGILLNLRVDDHPSPLSELRRAFDRHVAFAPMFVAIGGPVCRGPVLAEPAEVDAALTAFEAAQVTYGEDNLEPTFWKAVALWRADRRAEADALVRRISADNAGWERIFTHVVDPQPAASSVSERTSP